MAETSNPLVDKPEFLFVLRRVTVVRLDLKSPPRTLEVARAETDTGACRGDI